jgi:hypothetical protein
MRDRLVGRALLTGLAGLAGLATVAVPTALAADQDGKGDEKADQQADDASNDASGDADGAEPEGVHSTRADEEIVVYEDLFARWEGTRWFIGAEVQVPGVMWFAADEKYEMRISAFQLRAVLACDKEWKLSRRKMEVGCFLEDVGLQVVPFDPDYGHADVILNELDAKLTGARLQLQVKDNGRVTNIDLEDLPDPRNRRETRIQELLRMLLSRLVVGYDMKLRKSNFLSTGQWVENRSSLLTMPPYQVPNPQRSGLPSLDVLASGTVAPSSGLIVHQLNGYQGHVVVQTKGEGQIQDELGINYTAELTGVAIYDEDRGFMRERVWSLVARRTAESFDTWGFALVDYSHSGMLRMLGDDELAEVGPTRSVALPNQPKTQGMPLWKPLRPN